MTHPRRTLLALLAAPFLAFAGPATAPAKTFTFHSCDRASGANGSSAGWTTNGSEPNRSISVDCGANGAVQIKLAGGGPYASGLTASATWTAPTNLRIAGLNYRRYHNYFGENGWGTYSGAIGWYVEAYSGEASRMIEHCHRFPSAGCDPAGTGGPTVSGLDHDRIVAKINCWSGVPSPGCGQPHPELDPPEFGLDWMKVVLEDAHAPTVGRVVGPLTARGAHRGIETLEADMSDLGGGLYRTKVVVDGEVREVRSVDAAVTTCRDANTDNANAYEFDAPVPCPLARTATVALDTRGLSERAHAVRVLVEDVAGNERVVFSDDAFVVDNVVGAAASLPPQVAGTAQVGATLSGQAGTWRDALGEPAYQWLRCDSLGASCAPIHGAVKEQYVVGDADLGRRLRLRVDRVNAASEMTSATSEPTELIARSGTAAADGAAGPSGATGSNGANGAAGTNGAGGSAGLTTTTTTTTILVPNGTPAARDARLTLAFTRGGAAAQTVRWGKGATVAGRLTDASGTPVRGAVVTLIETPALPGAKPAATTTVTTDANGRFTRRIARTASSRTIRATYAADRGGPVVAEAQVRLAVTAAVKLAVTLKGVVVRYTGRVLSKPLPAGGKLVVVQGRVRGGSWQTFATRRATRDGRFSGRYRLRARTPGRVLQFRARVVAESGYAYRPATSRAVSRTVR